MRKQEAAITARVNKWFSGVVPGSSPWEIKHTRDADRFSLSELRPHQRDYLMAATTPHGCTFKIEDAGYHYSPFDVLHYKNTDAFVIVVFPAIVVAIEIRALLKAGKKSITADEATEIASYWTYAARLPK